MPRYTSRFKAVIKQRQHREDQARHEYAEALRLLTSEEDRLSKLQRQIDRALDEFARKQNDGMRAQELDLYNRLIRRQIEQLNHHRDVVRHLTERCENKRHILAQTTQDRKLIEQMEAARKKLFLKELDKKEQTLQDEMAGRRNGERHD